MFTNFSKEFRKKYRKLDVPIQESFNQRLGLFLSDPSHTLIRNHPLHGEWAGCYGINITGNYRAIYRHEQWNVVRFLAIGTHHELFGS